MRNLLLLRSAILGHLCLSLGVQAAREDWPELVLDERVLRISSIAADLSALAYANTTQIEQWVVDVNETTALASYEHPDYDEIEFYTEEPDQAIVAKKEGRCYLAFRGTNANIDDWLQNAGLGNADIYKDNINTGNPEDSCEARGGFADFLSSGPVARGRADLQACYDSCEDPDDCLVITGHSQGGATSSLAAITLFSLNPIVVTFGQPPSLDAGCPFINNDRFYRYVNWRQDPGQDDDIGFGKYHIIVSYAFDGLFLGASHSHIEFFSDGNKILWCTLPTGSLVRSTMVSTFWSAKILPMFITVGMATMSSSFPSEWTMRSPPIPCKEQTIATSHAYIAYLTTCPILEPTGSRRGLFAKIFTRNYVNPMVACKIYAFRSVASRKPASRDRVSKTRIVPEI